MHQIADKSIKRNTLNNKDTSLFELSDLWLSQLTGSLQVDGLFKRIILLAMVRLCVNNQRKGL